MTIGEKIAHLRNAYAISQEDLASKLEVSRQSVSKWESGQTTPTADKIVMLCDMFDLKADDLLRDEIVINKKPYKAEKVENKYFGTDGYRGEANVTLPVDHAYKIGRFLGWYFRSPLSGCTKKDYKPRIVIGKDTRRSSYTIEYALAAGISASGADAHILHVTTSPSVAYITRMDEFDCGVMITASHNPYYDNGIKIISGKGEKLDDKTAHLIEAYIDDNLSELNIDGKDIPLAKRDEIGSIVDYYAGRNRYIGYLISLASHSYRELRIGLDCANGASWSIAKTVFEALGAKVYVIGNEPNGVNINLNCGSTHIEQLQKLVKEKQLDVGYAFDGDADRCLAVDENGNVIDGDKIMYILAKRLLRKESLIKDTVVTTIMSNSGLAKALAKEGIKTVQTGVGDRFVYEEMEKHSYRLGGEQSGHIIIRQFATTGDGILTAIMLTEEMRSRRQSLATLSAPVILYPQVLKNVRVTSKDACMQDEEVLKKCMEITKEIGDNGRVLLRKSGTEPLIRIMVEAENEELCNAYIDRIYKEIVKRGFVCE